MQIVAIGCKAHYGFNRYMVECEYAELLSAHIYVTVLIDTWWNVNEYAMYILFKIMEF